MEIVLVLFLGAGAYFVYKALVFANFKSRLMHALAKHGLTYRQADDLYTVHAKLVGKLHSQGLSPEEIASGLSHAGPTDQDAIARVRDVYSLTGKLVKELRDHHPSMEVSAFSATEFVIKVGAFLASIKKHYGATVEDGSQGARLISAMGSNDIEVIHLIEQEVIGTVRQLPEDDATGFMFHFFWPKLHGELAKSDL